ncbi:hypothetical protein C1645_880782 [Glomus cerebriforme]|uniref:F-box domain-containing protein n=1 Tax=Glomus cerebriforme TaxID=658196 RepID=A0A397SK72_9GLOM|nr:hypothetical protein C1645_880782 [Glomus cerebriforme]
MVQLPADCLNKIFEYLEDDMVTLHSCLLVNYLWCEKGIVISTPTSKPPMFNYATFCKILSINQVYYKLELLLKDQQPFSTQNNTFILAQEIFKLYFNQINSLKELTCQHMNISFDIYPEAKDCLRNLSELCCSSDISSKFFYQLSEICHNILSIILSFEQVISKGITELISAQKNLKYLTIIHYTDIDLKDIISSVTNHNSLNKLCFYGISHYTSVPFITKFTNLQELELSFVNSKNFEKLQYIQYAIFPLLQILNIKNFPLTYDILISFIENNGKNLKEFYVDNDYGRNDNSLNLAITKFCPNLRKLSVGFKNNELETLKLIFNDCQYLESIKIWCGGKFLNEKVALDMFVNYSNKNTFEIILYHYYDMESKLLPKELESFFISWIDHVPQKSLSLIIVNDDDKSLDANEDNLKIIEKYKKLGVIKRFKVTDFDDDEFN